MCQLLDIQKTWTTPYHPQSDGMVERYNRTLEMQLSKFANYNQKDWGTFIIPCSWWHTGQQFMTSGCTPAELMLGRDLKLPIDLIYGRPEEKPAQTVTSMPENTSKWCRTRWNKGTIWTLLMRGNVSSKEMLSGSIIPRESKDSLRSYNAPGKALT